MKYLRILTGVTFIWIGIFIFMDPTGWGAFIQPWAQNLIFLPLDQVMVGTAVLDIALGILMLFNIFTWQAAAIASLHILIVLITSGINETTVRDIGLLGGTLGIYQLYRKQSNWDR